MRTDLIVKLNILLTRQMNTACGLYRPRPGPPPNQWPFDRPVHGAFGETGPCISGPHVGGSYPAGNRPSNVSRGGYRPGVCGEHGGGTLAAFGTQVGTSSGAFQSIPEPLAAITRKRSFPNGELRFLFGFDSLFPGYQGRKYSSQPAWARRSASSAPQTPKTARCICTARISSNRSSLKF